ncbi:uncharacterized protein LOC127863447 [Dreissena polymorpha]|uniref:uncharacterized protein LOC127863447 n=1 Tax=Dreissena polymorpha TaxID=45954 RepID=UPI002263E395|nr:uncharacterized protein LOC127863447 [Dreissena polymorpha]
MLIELLQLLCILPWKMRFKQPNPTKIPDHKYRRYSPESLKNAYAAVKENGMPVKRAALTYNVPIQTLRDRVKGKVDPFNIGLGSELIFSKEEETGLVEHLESMSQLGYGYTNVQVQHLAGELAEHLGKRPTNKPLSINWLYGFLKRWTGRLSSIKPRALDSGRAKNSTPEIVESYFKNLGEVVEKHNLTDKPHLIYNIDETGIQPEHRPPNVIAATGSKPQAVTSPRSTTTTLIACANAAGNHIPPFFVFKGKRSNPELMNGSSPGSKFTMSESGWSNAEIFQHYLKDHFLPNVCRGSTDQAPILVIYDGHSSHVSRQLTEWAKAENIILFVLPAHTSHILQPLDVSIFGPFKSYYYRECAKFMQEHIGETVTKYMMAKIACKAYLKAMVPANIVAGFRKTGIFPCCPEVVPADKLYPSEAFRETSPLFKIMEIKSGKEAVEKYLLLKAEKKFTCVCQASKQPKAKNTKPKPGGKAITEEAYAEELQTYDKENATPSTSTTSTHATTTSTKKGKTCRKRLSESQSQNKSTATAKDALCSDSEMEFEPEEKDLCCVCRMISPPNLPDSTFLKILTWGECAICSHWVHLKFCTKTRVVRRNDRFVCPNCEV